MVTKRPIDAVGGSPTTHRPHKRTTFDSSLPTLIVDLLQLPTDESIPILLPNAGVGQASTILERLKLLPVPGKRSSPPANHPFTTAMNNMGDALTENGAFAFSTTNSAHLDLYVELKHGVDAERLFALLDKSWKEGAEITLRIIFHARSIHEGKGFKEGVLRAMAWVYELHVLTLLANLHLITKPTCIRHHSAKRDQVKAEKNAAASLKEDLGVAELADDDELVFETAVDPEYPPRPHGCFKDLVDLLILAINGQLSTPYTGPLTALNEALAPKSQKNTFKAARLHLAATAQDKKRMRYVKLAKLTGAYLPRSRRVRAPARTVPTTSEETSINCNRVQKQMASSQKRQKHETLRTRLHERLTSNPKFTALYVVVVDIFVKGLRADLTLLDKHNSFVKLPEAERGAFKGNSSPHLFGMSYAAKWVPTPAHGADRQLFLATAIATRLFPEMDRANVNAARERLQGKVLSPLRAVTKVPETKMGQGIWHIDYTKVPARAMGGNAENFEKHDPQGYTKYLMDVGTGKKTISGASLMPHEPLIDAMSGSELRKNVGNAQWKALVDSIASSSSTQLTNCLAIADVSGSMGALHSSDKTNPAPITVCVALTLLLGELAESPWNSSFFTFSSSPSWETIDPTLSLSEKAAALSQAKWQMNTAFYKVFDLILDVAKRNGLTNDQMVKKLFCFSDMQFDNCGGQAYGVTEYQAIKAKFTKAGYDLPELIFWDLAAGRASGAQPTNKVVRADERGVALVSGFSGGTMKYFLQGTPPAETSTASGNAAGPSTRQAPTEAEQKKTALEHMHAILAKDCFNGLVVVD